MTANSLCVLNSVADAECFLRNEGKNKGWMLVSTHCSVVDYLGSKGIGCNDLSEFVTDEYVVECSESLDSSLNSPTVVNETVRVLDKAFSGELSRILRIAPRLDFFRLCFDYYLRVDLTGARQFIAAMESVLSTGQVNEILVYDSDTSILGVIRAVDLLERELRPEHGFRLRVEKSCGDSRILASNLPAFRTDKGLLKLARKIVARTRRCWRMMKSTCEAGSTEHDPSRKTLMLVAPLYDLECLREQHMDFNIMVWPERSAPDLPGVDLSRVLARVANSVDYLKSIDVSSVEMDKTLGARYLSGLVEKLAKNAEEWFTPLLCLAEYMESNSIDLCAWGNSPTVQTKALVVGYLRGKGIPIVGSQHGGNYGIQNCYSRHKEIDFDNCDHYLSYGMTADDIRNIYPHWDLNCEVIPVGSYSLSRTIDRDIEDGSREGIVFPLTNCISIVRNVRMNASELVRRQKTVLDVLETRTDIPVWVKPIPQSTDANFSLGKYLNTLDNVKVSFQPLNHFFMEQPVSLVVTEYPSGPLYYSLNRDVDIFMLTDPVYPFSVEATELLSKRVHIFDCLEDMLEAIRTYNPDTWPKLRNNEFFERYLYKPDAQGNIVREIERLLAKSGVEVRGGVQ